MELGLHGGGLRFVQQPKDRQAPDAKRVSYVAHAMDRRIDEAVISIDASIVEAERRMSIDVSDAVYEMLKLEAADAGRPSPDGRALTAFPRLYDRIVTDVKEADLPATKHVEELGDAMTKVPPRSNVSRIPAAFTYLGQFIAHDMSRMKETGDPTEPDNYRSAALDLDSIFGAPSEPCVAAEPLECAGGLCTGKTTLNRFEDLPRAANSLPCITDRRNDHNLAVSQLTVAIVKFHQAVAKKCGLGNVEAEKRHTRRHFQSLVLHDYLKRVIDDDVYDDVMRNGRRVIHADGPPPFFTLPVEFAAACFRFGHSQIRELYDWNEDHTSTTSQTLRHKSHIAGGYAPTNRLQDHWVVDWSRLLPEPQDPPETRFSAAIDCSLSSDLYNIEKSWFDVSALIKPEQHFVNLAKLTLLRGQSIRLPTAQQLADHLRGKLGGAAREVELISAADIFDTGGIAAHLSPAARADLEQKTPLWFYILREAEVKGHDGKHLGPLCSRIVMETIHVAIEDVPDNILTGELFQVDPNLVAASPNEFHWSDLLACIEAP